MLHFGAAFRALVSFTKNFRCRFSVQAIKAVQNIARGFDAFVCFLAAVGDLGVDSDVMGYAVAEEDSDSDVMLCR